MFVVFEGIDGAGKTTLSGLVSETLEALGVTVHQARPKGELKSRLASDIRTLARNPRNLTMSPHTELFLYIARDTQTVDTVIRPALDKAEVVIADRYLFSPLVLCRARGIVPKPEIDKAIEVAARGLWPDLVVYCDVDIDTSALRKALDKLIHPREPEDFGRKGLRGLGLRAAMRREYLDLAAADPERWLAVDNARATVEENSDRIAARILSLLHRDTPPRDPSRYTPYLGLEPAGTGAGEEAWRTAFYRYLNGLVDETRGMEAVYHARSIDSDETWALRERVIDRFPEIVAYGLGPLSSQRALEMRRRLIDKTPLRVARSLADEWANDHDEAWRMREALAKKVPVDVAMTIGRIDTERAWALRERLQREAPVQVLSSLKGFDTERAWALREALGRKKWAPGLLRGLAYLETERAWKLRDKYRRDALPWVILSTLGCESERAYALRRSYLEVATKLVMRSLAGSESEEAWEMRRQAGPWAKEALTTIKNIDTAQAWALRESLAGTWPGATAKSVGLTLGLTEKGFGYILDLANRNPHNPDVVHYLVKLIEVKRSL